MKFVKNNENKKKQQKSMKIIEKSMCFRPLLKKFEKICKIRKSEVLKIGTWC